MSNRIKKVVIAEIEKALGDTVLIGVCDESRLKFKIVVSENLEGKWNWQMARMLARGKIKATDRQ